MPKKDKKTWKPKTHSVHRLDKSGESFGVDEVRNGLKILKDDILKRERKKDDKQRRPRQRNQQRLEAFHR